MKYLVLIILILAVVSCNRQKVTLDVTEEEKNVLHYFFAQLRKGNDDHALELINQFVTKEDIIPLDLIVLNKVEPFGIKQSFLERKTFTDLDLFYLKQCLLFKDLSSQFSKGQESNNLIRTLFEKVRENIKERADSKVDQSAFPMQIWQRGFGLCDRQSWVMCEMAYQAGAEVYIIYFRDPETLISHHTICEVYFKGKSYVIDPLYNKFIEDTKFSDLSSQEIAEIWKGYPILHDDHKKAVMFSPIMVHDFAPRINQFGDLCRQILGSLSPRIGETPNIRMAKRPAIENEDYRLWDYPLRLLASTPAYKSELTK